ncbi:MAG: imidazole glycerol phosphate synthase subunit HisF [Gammaproteobacteria bacterium]|nr:imidazole glycerol phosphate synthase subunit HisF [Gammaproteobacteria bacterium]
MITKRIIPCLDVRDDHVVKGIQFKNHKIVGSIVDLAQKYSEEGADELVFYDITASTDGSTVSKEWVSKISDVINIPFCVAGGIKSVNDARSILNLGADKVSINTPALENPNLIRELSLEFGSQCVVIGMDIKTIDGKSFLFAKTGNELTAHSTEILALDWIRKVQKLGAGEVVINSMNQDGMKNGYDISLLNELSKVCTLPMIASGGAGSDDHFINVFANTNVDGALAASIFHNNEYSIQDIKTSLQSNKINIRTSL